MCLLIITLTGCLSLSKSYPEKRSFVLDVGAPPQETPSNSIKVLRINRLRVSPLFAGRAMVYRTADLQYESDFYDEWFVTPSVLVTQQLQNWLAHSGRFLLVLQGTNHIEPTHFLEGTVTEFYGDFRESPRAVLGIEFHLLDAMNEGQLSFRRTYHQDIPLTDRSPDALARGLTEALRTVLVTLTKDIGEVQATPTGRVSPP
ncbi:MAG TPA: ABC-type transport auxiliary lipoprotein family protein [Nitrospira sp.]|nr:ABC-type transport auxiliary lipoprotein family protein [Nitrospira sp.]